MSAAVRARRSRAGPARDRLDEDVDLFVDDAREPAHALGDGERHEAEELRAHAALAHARKVDVAAERRARQRRLVARVQVVAEPARPHERVGVQVDRRVLGVKRSGLLGAAHRVAGVYCTSLRWRRRASC